MYGNFSILCRSTLPLVLLLWQKPLQLLLFVLQVSVMKQVKVASWIWKVKLCCTLLPPWQVFICYGDIKPIYCVVVCSFPCKWPSRLKATWGFVLTNNNCILTSLPAVRSPSLYRSEFRASPQMIPVQYDRQSYTFVVQLSQTVVLSVSEGQWKACCAALPSAMSRQLMG